MRLKVFPYQDRICLTLDEIEINAKDIICTVIPRHHELELDLFHHNHHIIHCDIFLSENHQVNSSIKVKLPLDVKRFINHAELCHSRFSILIAFNP